MKIWEGKSDKLLHEIQDQFSGARQTKSIGTLVNRVHNNIDWAVIGKCEGLLQVLYQHVVCRLKCAVVVSHVYGVEHIAVNIGASRKLR